MNNNFERSHILKIACLAQLTYVAYNQGEEVTNRASLQEHRAIRYVERLNYGELPSWNQNLDK